MKCIVYNGGYKYQLKEGYSFAAPERKETKVALAMRQ
jgi:hypothetical protein